ncbi:MAG: BMP family ABC transporter substrate-binding protein [Aeromicrobium sp.]
MSRCFAVLCAVALMVAGCGRAPEELPVPTSQDLCKGAVGDGPKVGMAYDVGGRNDRGINDAAFAGLSEAVDELKATCVEGEAAEGEQEAARIDRLQQFADNGANVIVAVGTSYVRAVDKVSQSYPRIQFALVDAITGKRTLGRNVAVLRFNPEQAGFLAGAAAALKSATGVVGFVGAPAAQGLEPADPYQAGFQAGVTAAKPTVQVVATRLERDTPAPGKPDSATKVTKAQFEDSDVDVVFGSPGVSERALFNAARAEGDGTWVVGIGSDQFQAATEDQKPHILTSVIKRYDTVTFDFLKSVADRKPVTGRHVYGLDDGALGFVTSGKFLTRKQVTKLSALRHQVESGAIQVPNRLG